MISPYTRYSYFIKIHYYKNYYNPQQMFEELQSFAQNS